jgi:hypothetical protein
LKPFLSHEENEEEGIVDAVLFQQSDIVVWDGEPIDDTMIWDDEEENVVDGMGDTVPFDINIETILDRPCGEKSFLDEAMLDHDATPPFGDCMISSSEPIGFDEGSVLIAETQSYLEIVMHNNVSGTHGLREEPLVMILCKENLELQVLDERYDVEGFEYALVLNCGDHDLFLLESPVRDQGSTTKEIVEHIPCGLARKEVNAPMDWVDKYMKDMGTLWDTS